jgi:hypothetical protein
MEARQWAVDSWLILGWQMTTQHTVMLCFWRAPSCMSVKHIG